MIRINLLPAEQEAAPRQINPTIPLVVSGLIPGLVLLFIHSQFARTKSELQKEAVSLRSELDRYQPIIAQVEALEQAKTQLTNRKNIIQQLESERLRYPQFMDDFLKLLPSNLWLTTLNTAQQASGNALVVNMDVVALDNYAIADLVANLETSQIFSDVELGTISAATGQFGQTMGFHITTTYRRLATVSDAPQKS